MISRRAPFTADEVANLVAWQECGLYHPFTCPNRGELPHPPNAVLAPDEESGWTCGHCDYTQDWAHDFMLDGSAVRNARETIKQIRKGESK